MKLRLLKSLLATFGVTSLSPLDFWNNVHLENQVSSIGNATHASLVSALSVAGPFIEQYENVQSYLDIGPGLGTLLLESKAHRRAAFDISAPALENISSLSGGRIDTYLSPLLPPQNCFELVTCISVIQHCDLAALKVLLEIAYRSLGSSGVFYIEGLASNCVKVSPEYDKRRLVAGTYYWLPADVESVWLGSTIDQGVFEAESEGIDLFGWVMQLSK